MYSLETCVHSSSKRGVVTEHPLIQRDVSHQSRTITDVVKHGCNIINACNRIACWLRASFWHLKGATTLFVYHIASETRQGTAHTPVHVYICLFFLVLSQRSCRFRKPGPAVLLTINCSSTVVLSTPTTKCRYMSQHTRTTVLGIQSASYMRIRWIQGSWRCWRLEVRNTLHSCHTSSVTLLSMAHPRDT